jgi:filamentous hemagglutinin
VASAGNTTLSGAEVHADQIVAAVGGTLAITSLQDTGAQQQHASSFGIGVGVSAGGVPSGSISISSSKGDANYASVTSPSGLFAGDGGFQISAGATVLTGGYITSSATAAAANANNLTTGTLVTQNIDNASSYSTKTGGIGLSLGAGPGMTGLSTAMPQGKNGSDSSTTTSGVTQNGGGLSVHITDTTGQLAATGQTADQAAAALAAASQGLTTDNVQSHAGVLANTPDIAAILQTQQQRQDAAAAAGYAIARTEGDIAQALHLEEGSGGKAILQGAGAGLLAGLGGGDVAGAVGGAVASQLAAPTLIKLGNEAAGTLDPNGTTGKTAIADLVSNLASNAVGGLVGGGSGASVAGTFNQYNRQLHKSEQEKLATLEAGKSEVQKQQLEEAACYLVRCWYNERSDGITVPSDPWTLASIDPKSPEYAWAIAELTKGGGFTEAPREISSENANQYNYDHGAKPVYDTNPWTLQDYLKGQGSNADLLIGVAQGIGRSVVDTTNTVSNQMSLMDGSWLASQFTGVTPSIPTPDILKPSNGAQDVGGYLGQLTFLIAGFPATSGAIKALGAGADLSSAISTTSGIAEGVAADSEAASLTRPSWRQSEIDVGNELGSGARPQVSYLDGNEVRNGTPNSVRPDFVAADGSLSFEVKNYNVATTTEGLISNVVRQAEQRAANLPEGMQQQIIIDVRGQALSLQQEISIRQAIVQRSNGVISPNSIRFKAQ